MLRKFSRNLSPAKIKENKVFSGIYLQALLDKIAPEEDLILTYYYECKNSERILASGIDSQFTKEEAEEIVKNAREISETETKRIFSQATGKENQEI